MFLTRSKAVVNACLEKKTRQCDDCGSRTEICILVTMRNQLEDFVDII